MSNLDTLAFEFFREFARCECCMKVVGFRMTSRKAQPDWDKFAKALDPVLDRAKPKVAPAIKYFFEHPPKQQIVENGKLTWDKDEPDGGRSTKRLLELLRRVRNNLFHGGKFTDCYLEPERDIQLLEHGLVLLQVCIASEPSVRDAYSSIF